jgi:hypothetical protein
MAAIREHRLMRLREDNALVVSCEIDDEKPTSPRR